MRTLRQGGENAAGSRGPACRPDAKGRWTWAQRQRLIGKAFAHEILAARPLKPTALAIYYRQYLIGTLHESDLAQGLAVLTDGNAAKVLTLLSLPDDIRGFGPVKAEAMALAAKRRVELRADLGLSPERIG